ncbi:PREDICTED: putative cleavage and polyadenylation specificity factor subunit 4-like protein [Calidris pugnax]|uniref:putative cleavage and polyadenylation specificity factor subunit 4-like protein n=1 Tax=Calidris pugnax TaxID=198806 RepID=UPI00071E3D33|nr:PREDICTED: putative cleavage and polyadenylation specificity factor subunit 4-like protein [Calidris pugnax]
MQELVAGVERIRFELEADVEQQRGAQPLPFLGTDRPGVRCPVRRVGREKPVVCKHWLRGLCKKGDGCDFLHEYDVTKMPQCYFYSKFGVRCPVRRVGREKPVVCKHWLRGLCKKGDGCDFLHEYDVTKMPQCYFYSKFGECGNKDCPFLHIDGTTSATGCPWYDRVFCRHGVRCPVRRVGREKPVVCKHWLRGLCKKGDGCDFLHEYDVTKMPQCYFYSKFGECGNKDCPFLHIDGTTSATGCPWYDRGFCRHGPLCKYRHTRRVMCSNYLVGFCPEGPKCKFMHLKAGLMTSSMDPPKGAGCPWGLAQLDLAASEESGHKDTPPMVSPLPVTGATQHLGDTSSCPPGPQGLQELGITQGVTNVTTPESGGQLGWKSCWGCDPRAPVSTGKENSVMDQQNGH